LPPLRERTGMKTLDELSYVVKARRYVHARPF